MGPLRPQSTKLAELAELGPSQSSSTTLIRFIKDPSRLVGTDHVITTLQISITPLIACFNLWTEKSLVMAARSPQAWLRKMVWIWSLMHLTGGAGA
jgi:hypothetical protein